MKASAVLFPFERRYRTAHALWFGEFAYRIDNVAFMSAAVSEMKEVLQRDPTQADLLAYLILTEVGLHRMDDARADFRQFRRLTRSKVLDRFGLE